VAIVNDAFVRAYLPREPAVGKDVMFGWGTDATQRIVGVVADLREGPLDAPPRPAVYVSAAQVPNSFMNLIVRTSRRPDEVRAAYSRALRDIDPALPVVDVRRVSAVLASTVRQRRVTTSILATFALATLLLAAIGLFGVISYSVGQRSQELGVRAALGAKKRDLVWMIVRQTMGWVAGGVAIGTLGSIALARLVAAQLVDVSATEPSAFILAAALLAGVAVVASAGPTLRAANADPLDALRGN
jgi:predicted lysophospholipase L1 biosynthesis ABC-type transport system permease subunit